MSIIDLKKAGWVAAVLLLTGGIFKAAVARTDPRDGPALTACYHKVCFPASAGVFGHKLRLRSAGKKDWWHFSLYHAGLYLPEGISRRDALTDVPKKLVLRYRRSIDAEKIVEAADHHLLRNPDIDLPAIRARVDYLHSLYRSVNQDDEYALAYDPGAGTQLYLNNEKQGELIPGSDFARAYFGIWLSRHVVCRKLRAELLDLN